MFNALVYGDAANLAHLAEGVGWDALGFDLLGVLVA